MRSAWISTALLVGGLLISGKNCQAAQAVRSNQPSQSSKEPPCGALRAALAGVWQLDLSISSMGSDHPSAKYVFTKTFELHGVSLLETDHELNAEMIGIITPERKTIIELFPDGQEHEIDGPSLFPGRPRPRTKITVAWQGNNLVVAEAGEGFGGASTTARRYFLSDDGSLLTELVVGHNSFGDSEQKLVFTRLSQKK